MIPNESSLFLDIGSTTAYIADALRGHRKLVVVTNSVYVAYRLSMRNENRVFVAGGELRSEDGGVFGADAMAFVANFRTDFAICRRRAWMRKTGSRCSTWMKRISPDTSWAVRRPGSWPAIPASSDGRRRFGRVIRLLWTTWSRMPHYQKAEDSHAELGHSGPPRGLGQEHRVGLLIDAPFQLIPCRIHWDAG